MWTDGRRRTPDPWVSYKLTGEPSAQVSFKALIAKFDRAVKKVMVNTWSSFEQTIMGLGP